MATKRRTTASRTTRKSKASSNKNTYFDKALAYLIVSIVVYGCFIYNPNEDPLQGETYGQRLRSERDAYQKGIDIYDYRNKDDVRRYNRSRSAGSPSYYNSRNGGYAERGRSRRYSSSIYRK